MSEGAGDGGRDVGNAVGMFAGRYGGRGFPAVGGMGVGRGRGRGLFTNIFLELFMPLFMPDFILESYFPNLEKCLGYDGLFRLPTSVWLLLPLGVVRYRLVFIDLLLFLVFFGLFLLRDRLYQFMVVLGALSCR